VKDAMTPNQHARAAELIERAGKSLNLCRQEDLGLNDVSEASLRAAIEAVDDFRLSVKDQPRKGELL
jgi:hypothetical protein